MILKYWKWICLGNIMKTYFLTWQIKIFTIRTMLYVELCTFPSPIFWSNSTNMPYMQCYQLYLKVLDQTTQKVDMFCLCTKFIAFEFLYFLEIWMKILPWNRPKFFVQWYCEFGNAAILVYVYPEGQKAAIFLFFFNKSSVDLM